MFSRFSNPSSVCLILLICLLTLAGCNSGDPFQPPEEEQPPALPQVSTMKMDLSFFSTASSYETSIKEGVPGPELLSQYPTKYNFINAAVRVLFVDLVILAAMEPPVAAFVVALHSVPQHQPDGSWLWTYIFVDGDIEYSIFLRGKKVEDYTEWSMRVSSTNPEMLLDHFLWFEGEAMNDDSGGYWQFYEPDETVPLATLVSAGGELETPGVPSVRIDWENLPEDTHLLSFLINKAGSPDEGSSVEFFQSPDVCYMEFYDVSKDATGTIKWYADGSGSIEVPDYNDGEKACWDNRQNDVDCSE